VEPINDRTCRLHTHTDTLERLAFWLLMLGCDFAVDHPPELAQHLRELGARATRAAPAGGPGRLKSSGRRSTRSSRR
jgi:hypothetical protein